MGDQPSIQQNQQIFNEPSLQDALNMLKKEIGISYNSLHVGIIQSFDATKQTAQISIAYTKTYFQTNDKGVVTPVSIPYSILAGVPVICLSGGPGFLTFPISSGDECLVLFNDRSIDNWYASGQVGPVQTSRLHSLADGFALVGIRNSTKQLQNYSQTHTVLGAGLRGVAVSQLDGVKIYNATTTLGIELFQLMAALNTFVVGCSNSVTDPILAAAAAAFLPSITTITTALSTLLE